MKPKSKFFSKCNYSFFFYLMLDVVVVVERLLILLVTIWLSSFVSSFLSFFKFTLSSHNSQFTCRLVTVIGLYQQNPDIAINCRLQRVFHRPVHLMKRNESSIAWVKIMKSGPDSKLEMQAIQFLTFPLPK